MTRPHAQAAKARADQLLVEQGLAESRAKAQALILAGVVSCAGRRIDKPGEQLAADAALTVKGHDHPWVSLLARRFYRRLLTNGVRIWEWQGEMMHAKTSVIDGRWVRVGSTDFNPLGVAINYELDAVIEDATLGRAAEEMFLADLEDSREVTL